MDEDIVSTTKRYFSSEILLSSYESMSRVNTRRSVANFVKIMGNLDTREGRESLPIIKSMIPWTEKIYDMTDEQIEEYKSAFRYEYHNSEEKHEREVIDVFYIEYQYYQVRKTYAWVMEQYSLSGDKMAIRREILLQRLRGSNASPVDPEDIEFLISNMKKSDRDMLLCGKWRFRLYDHGIGTEYGRMRDFDENIPYIVSIDPAGGGGGDNFAVYVTNPYNLQIAAEFKSPYISGPNAVRMLIELIQDHIPKGVLIPEKNSMGIYLIQMLLETSVRDNLYWSESTRQMEEMTEEDGTDSQLKAESAAYKKYGHYTGKNRKAMFEILFQHLAECKEILTTEYLVDDICKLVRTTTGRIEADKGEHDDCLMAYLIGMYVYYTGDNLETFGIHRSENPVWGPIEEDDENGTANAAQFFDNYENLEQKTFDEEFQESAARLEDQIKTLVNTFDFVHDPVYSPQRDQQKQNTNQYDETVSIGSWFFDQMNGIYN